MLAMNDAGLHQLVRDFMLRNQALIEAASPSYANMSSQESAERISLNPNILFPPRPNDVAVAVAGRGGEVAIG